MSDSVLCRECGHDIDYHEFNEPCWGAFYLAGYCDCGFDPSDVARALLTAEPTEDEVERAADAINAVDIGQMSHREIRLAFARAALRAARGCRD